MSFEEMFYEAMTQNRKDDQEEFAAMLKLEKDNCLKCEKHYCDMNCSNTFWFKYRFIIGGRELGGKRD